MRATIRREVLLIKNKTVVYSIKKHHFSRRLRLSVNNQGKVVVTIPRFTAFVAGINFAKSHIDWIQKNLERVAVKPDWRDGLSASEHYKKYYYQARVLINKKLRQWSAIYGFKYGTVSVRNQSSRWGSCSKKDNLNFNYRLLFLTEKLVDYVVAHELCHTQEHNHSAKFWKLVADKIPDYQARRNELQRFN